MQSSISFTLYTNITYQSNLILYHVVEQISLTSFKYFEIFLNNLQCVSYQSYRQSMTNIEDFSITETRHCGMKR